MTNNNYSDDYSDEYTAEDYARFLVFKEQWLTHDPDECTIDHHFTD